MKQQTREKKRVFAAYLLVSAVLLAAVAIVAANGVAGSVAAGAFSGGFLAVAEIYGPVRVLCRQGGFVMVNRTAGGRSEKNGVT